MLPRHYALSRMEKQEHPAEVEVEVWQAMEDSKEVEEPW